MKRRKAVGLFGGVLGLSACFANTNPGRPLLSKKQPPSPDYVGLNVGSELNWRSWRDQLVPLYKQAGIRWLRVWYNWASLEPKPGEYRGDDVKEALRLAKQNGFKILFVIWGTPPHAGKGELSDVPQMTAFSNYCRWLKNYLRGLVDAWEIGNEPNLKKYYNGSPSSYVKTLATAYPILKDNGLVIAAGPSGASTPDYWQALIDAGWEKYCDRVNYHPYRKRPKEVIARVDRFLQKVKKPLWITELGFSTDHGGEQAKAKFLEAVLPQLATRVEQIFWYRSIQGKTMHPLRFGLIEVERETKKVTPLPAYFSYRTYIKSL